MTDNVDKEYLAEVVEIYRDAYKKALYAGHNRAQVKAIALDAISDFVPDETYIVNSGLMPLLGSAARKIRIEYERQNPDSPEEDTMPTCAGAGDLGAKISPSQAIVDFILSLSPSVGDEICIGNLNLLGQITGTSATAWSYPFRATDDQPIPKIHRDTGYTFDVLSNTYKNYIVKVTAAPSSAPDGVDPDTWSDFQAFLKWRQNGKGQ